MKRIGFAFVLCLALCGNAHARRHLSTGGSGGTTTNYAGAIINGVFTTFICSGGTCTVVSPDWLAGRTVVQTSSGWVLL